MDVGGWKDPDGSRSTFCTHFGGRSRRRDELSCKAGLKVSPGDATWMGGEGRGRAATRIRSVSRLPETPDARSSARQPVRRLQTTERASTRKEGSRIEPEECPALQFWTRMGRGWVSETKQEDASSTRARPDVCERPSPPSAPAMSNPTPADLWDSLAIVPSPQGRSRCVTTRPLAVRGTVLLSSVPMAAVLVDQAKGRRCDECLRPLGTAKGAKKTCSGCKEDVYCSVGCEYQRGRW